MCLHVLLPLKGTFGDRRSRLVRVDARGLKEDAVGVLRLELRFYVKVNFITFTSAAH